MFNVPTDFPLTFPPSSSKVPVAIDTYFSVAITITHDNNKTSFRLATPPFSHNSRWVSQTNTNWPLFACWPVVSHLERPFLLVANNSLSKARILVLYPCQRHDILEWRKMRLPFLIVTALLNSMLTIFLSKLIKQLTRWLIWWPWNLTWRLSGKLLDGATTARGVPPRIV